MAEEVLSVKFNADRLLRRSSTSESGEVMRETLSLGDFLKVMGVGRVTYSLKLAGKCATRFKCEGVEKIPVKRLQKRRLNLFYI